MLRLASSAAPRGLPETHVWASRISVPNGIWSEPTLTRSSHQGWSAASTTLASECGKYTQSDPIALAGGSNLFLYADANPAGASDPSGLAVVNVKVWDEKHYNTISAYQKANPCNAAGSFSCTQRLQEDIGCICSCKGNGWGADVQFNIGLRYHLAGAPAGSNTPPSWFWAKYRQHEDLHTNHLRQQLQKYGQELETQRFESATECNLMCGKAIVGFGQWLNNWATASNQQFH